MVARKRHQTRIIVRNDSKLPAGSSDVVWKDLILAVENCDVSSLFENDRDVANIFSGYDEQVLKRKMDGGLVQDVKL